MPSALLDETRSERLPINLSFLPQLRVSPTIRDLLDRERPANETWADFAISSMVQRALHDRIMRLDLAGAKSLLVTILGATQDIRHTDQPAVSLDVTGVTSYDERQAPVQMRLKTAMVAVQRRGR